MGRKNRMLCFGACRTGLRAGLGCTEVLPLSPVCYVWHFPTDGTMSRPGEPGHQTASEFFNTYPHTDANPALSPAKALTLPFPALVSFSVKRG